MPNSARNHDENQKVLCLMCLKKANKHITTFRRKKFKLSMAKKSNLMTQEFPKAFVKHIELL